MGESGGEAGSAVENDWRRGLDPLGGLRSPMRVWSRLWLREAEERGNCDELDPVRKGLDFAVWLAYRLSVSWRAKSLPHSSHSYGRASVSASWSRHVRTLRGRRVAYVGDETRLSTVV